MTQPPTKEREVLLNIIEIYKDMPFLWDKRHKDYKNKDVRNDANKVLLEIYKGLDSNATLKTLIKKIQNLRTGYFKELKKVKETSHTGAGADEVYVPKLWYFNAMSFLGSVSEPCRSGRDTMETEEISTSSSETESVRKSESAFTSPQKKKRVTKATLLQKHESLVNRAGKLLNMKEEEWEIIGKGIGLQLKDLNKRQFYIAQKIIHDTLYYAQMGMLTEHSSVTGLNNHSQHTYESTVGNRRTAHQVPFCYPVRRQDTQTVLSGSSSSPKYYINSDSQSSFAIPSSPSPCPKELHILSPHPSPSYHIQPPHSSPISLPQEPSSQPVIIQLSHPSASHHTRPPYSSSSSLPQEITTHSPHPSDNDLIQSFPPSQSPQMQLELSQSHDIQTVSTEVLSTTAQTTSVPYEVLNLDSNHFPNTTVYRGDGNSVKDYLIFKQKK